MASNVILTKILLKDTQVYIIIIDIIDIIRSSKIIIIIIRRRI